MADFRKCIIVLATLALLLGTAVTASAQVNPFTCTATATNNQLRHEGETEKLGDFLLTCVGGAVLNPGVVAPTVNIQIFLNTSVTSRIMNSSTNGTDALLLIDEPTEAQEVVCAAPCATNVIGTGAAPDPYLNGTNPNVFQGAIAPGSGPGGLATNSIVWNGVGIIAPGTTGIRAFRITNVRGDATQIALSTGNVSPLTVTETIAVSNPAVLPIQSFTAQQSVGVVLIGLVVAPATGLTFQQCFSQSDVSDGSITLTKGFPTAFKLLSAYPPPGPPAQDTPGATYNPDTESFFWGPVIDTALGANAGLADHATRLRIAFTNVNSGVSVTVPTPIVSGSLTITAVATCTGADPIDNCGANTGTLAAGTVTVALDSTGNGEVIYEVTATNSAAAEGVTVPFTISYTANPGSATPALTPPVPPGPVALVGASFAPLGTAPAYWSDTNPYIPRFLDTFSANAVPFIYIVACRSHLLFPFTANLAGYDTGLAISNTSQDPYGTSTQTGTCTLNFYGSNGPWAPSTTPAVPPGTTLPLLLSTLQPGFEGYIIVDCNFQYAHGFAYLTQTGTFQGTMGYLALVIPDDLTPTGRAPNPVSCPPSGAGCASGSGEQLGQ